MAVTVSPRERNVFLSGRARFAVLMLYLGALLLLQYWANGQVMPSTGLTGLWFLAALAYVSFALLSAPFFFRPEDTLASGIASTLLLWSTDVPAGKVLLSTCLRA